MSPNQYLFSQLAARLSAQGHHVEPSTETLSLTVDGQLEIAGAILDTPQYHPRLMQALLLVLHPRYFPHGIEDYVVGLGETTEQKADAVLGNFLAATLPPILESLAPYHQPALDFTDARGTRWHPVPGPLVQQGPWPPGLEGEPLWERVQARLPAALPDQPFSWLKIYLARNAADLTVSCQLNNQPWEAADADLAAYVESWSQPADFLGLRQFIMLRRCPA